MKKVILTVCCMICACVVYAQNPVGNLPKIRTPFKAVKVQKYNPNLAEVKHKSPKTFVADKPEGEVKSYKRSGWSYMEDWDGIYRTQQSGLAKVVFAENNEVYLQNVLAYINSGKWVKGTLGEDKKTITIAPGEIVEQKLLLIHVISIAATF